MTVVGLIGKAHAGKDSLAERLVERHGFTRVAFADALKQAALAANPLVAPFCDSRLAALVEARGWDEAKKFPEVRRFLQAYGMAIREVSPGFWVNVVDSKIVEDTEHDWVVTDVRFQDELEMIYSYPDGHVVSVVRPGHDNGLGINGQHPSETALDGTEAELTVVNTGTLEDLDPWVDAIARLGRG